MPVFIFTVGSIPDEAKALSLLAPANAVAGMMPGGGLLPTPNPIPNPAVRLQVHRLIHICDLMWKKGDYHRSYTIENDSYRLLIC